MNSGKVLLGLLAGVAAGALAGILLAPDKGSETRRKILEKGEGYADAIKDKFNTFIDTVTDKYENVKEDISGLPNRGFSTTNGAENSSKA